jgi:hypothetical protein
MLTDRDPAHARVVAQAIRAIKCIVESTQASTLYSNNKINAGLAARNLVAGGVFLATGNPAIGASCLAASTAMSGVLGVLMTASIRAADLAVLIALLNAYSGLALAAEGVLLNNDLLTIVGTLIASSGPILLYIMCTSMNRSLANFILGGAFIKTNVKSTIIADEKYILEHSEANIATVSDALTTAQDNNFICSRDQLSEALLFGDDNHKRRAMHSAFCSRDQLAEARNAITCALTYFILTSIAIRHAARDTTRGWRNLLTRPLADDVPCSRNHSQNVLAT